MSIYTYKILRLFLMQFNFTLLVNHLCGLHCIISDFLKLHFLRNLKFYILIKTSSPSEHIEHSSNSLRFTVYWPLFLPCSAQSTGCKAGCSH